MVAEGKGEELLSVAVGATPGIFSARTHLDKYGKDDRNDCRPYAKRLGCPLLAIVGGAEPKFFTNTRKVWSERQGPVPPIDSSRAGITFTINTRARLSRSFISGWRASTDSVFHLMLRNTDIARSPTIVIVASFACLKSNAAPPRNPPSRRRLRS